MFNVMCACVRYFFPHLICYFLSADFLLLPFLDTIWCLCLLSLLLLWLLFSFDSLISPNCSILIAVHSTISTKLLINLLHLYLTQENPSCAQTAAPLAGAACATSDDALTTTALMSSLCVEGERKRDRESGECFLNMFLIFVLWPIKRVETIFIIFSHGSFCSACKS